jgi:hypothetical protein
MQKSAKVDCGALIPMMHSTRIIIITGWESINHVGIPESYPPPPTQPQVPGPTRAFTLPLSVLMGVAVTGPHLGNDTLRETFLYFSCAFFM